MPETHVIEIPAADLVWPFGEGGPSFSVKDGNYTRAEKVDPFPAYAHDLGLVRKEIERTAKLFPIGAEVNVYVSHFEDVARTNAHAFPGWDYSAEEVAEVVAFWRNLL